MDNLIALSAFTGLNEKDPSLVNYMIRVAILNLGVSVYWDALQATGWTDDQLAELQRACQAVALLSQMSKVPEAERVGRLHQLEQFRSGTYEQWITRHQAVIASLGQRRLARDMGPLVRFWRQWGFHPLWRLAWACPEELLYLQHMQTEIEAIRAATRQGQWSQLKHRLEEIHQPYQLPATRWRFYYRLPILDDLSEIIGPAPGPTNRCPFVDFTKAWSTTYKTLTLNNLVITAIALKRHFLRYGKYPDTLNDLCPEYLSAVPLDLMDGQPLRYHLNSGGAYVLYSIGDDLKDDHGTARLDLESDSSWINPWLGPDWVWPQ